MRHLLPDTLYREPSLPESGALRILNRLLRALRLRYRLTHRYDPCLHMTTVEQRVNTFHLLDQVLAYQVPGDVVEIGCYLGHTAVLLQQLLQRYPAPRTLHLYDDFAWSGHGARDVRAECEAAFRNAGLPLPAIHPGRFEQTLPDQLPATICFAHFDCGVGGDRALHARVLHEALTHVYPRMAPGAIGLLMDYHHPRASAQPDYNPGVADACGEFFRHHPEDIIPLYGGEYSHGFFRKMRS